jgi:hypothetical protein
MSPSQRHRLARPVVLVYWLLVGGGLVLYSSARLDSFPALVPLWIGAVGGTLLGQFLAVRDLRLWITSLIIIVATYFTMPLMTAGFADLALWKVLIPAALCGFWSLGDRSVLTAFWFPVVLWMLSILDRTDGKLAPDGPGVVLLGALAVLFLLFLRVRESRRVGLWCEVSAEPLAPTRPAALLREPPARQLARAGWGLAATAITAAITAWIAPRLWHVEPLQGDEILIADATPARGLPCCPSARLAETARARVKEYLDLGLGHDDGEIPSDETLRCLVCDGVTDDLVAGAPATRWAPTGYGGRGDTVTEGGGGGGGGGRTGTPAGTGAPVEASAPATVPASEVAVAGVVEEPQAPVQAPDPLALAAPSPPPVAAPAPVVEPTPAPPAAEPTPAPAPLPAVAARTSRPDDRPRTHGTQHRAAAPALGPSLLPWLLALAATALVFQLVVLALRPLRRLITLRHLRRPLWAETIDQRVSNAWQLALVGLRDAGWRPESSEAPRELAARVGVDGVERCAVILERARHGLGLDKEDLSEMTASADAAYHSARSELGGFTRAIAWIRWPLT